jgi:hypothetical protein
MARTKQSAELEIEVDGEPYVWRLHRQPGWSSDAPVRHGMAIAVRHRYGAPLLKAAQIDLKLVKNAIASAIAAGWDPLSRGKTVAIVVDATGA